jgi:hypothetical protein
VEQKYLLRFQRAWIRTKLASYFEELQRGINYGTNLALKFDDLVKMADNAGELTTRRNQIFSSLLKTYEKLKKLGLVYYNGKVSILENDEE